MWSGDGSKSYGGRSMVIRPRNTRVRVEVRSGCVRRGARSTHQRKGCVGMQQEEAGRRQQSGLGHTAHVCSRQTAPQHRSVLRHDNHEREMWGLSASCASLISFIMRSASSRSSGFLPGCQASHVSPLVQTRVGCTCQDDVSLRASCKPDEKASISMVENIISV